jgi:cobalt transporter subunit CbtB
MTLEGNTRHLIAVERADPRLAAMLAFALGVALVFGIGFASPDAMHNAAHDTRHAISFPCH